MGVTISANESLKKFARLAMSDAVQSVFLPTFRLSPLWAIPKASAKSAWLTARSAISILTFFVTVSCNSMAELELASVEILIFSL